MAWAVDHLPRRPLAKAQLLQSCEHLRAGLAKRRLRQLLRLPLAEVSRSFDRLAPEGLLGVKLIVRPLPLGGPILALHDDGGLNRGQTGEHQIRQDERIGIEGVERDQPTAQDRPAHQEEEEAQHERPRAAHRGQNAPLAPQSLQRVHQAVARRASTTDEFVVSELPAGVLCPTAISKLLELIVASVDRDGR
jgi:hypothetical protein